MDVSVKHLVERNGNFYFRRRLPNYTGEINISLQTSDLKKAVVHCKLLAVKLDSLINSGAVKVLSIQEIRSILAKYITENLESYARSIANFGHICPATRQEGKQVALNIIEYYEKQRDTDNQHGKDLASELLKDIPHDESDFNFMAQEAILATIFIARMQYERLDGKSFLTEYSKEIYDRIMGGNYKSAQEIREAEIVLTLGELSERYLSEKSSGWGESMRDSVNVVLTTFMEYFSPEKNIKSFRHQDLLDYRDNVLLRLPPRRNTCPEYKDVSLHKLIESSHETTLSKKTVNIMMGKISGFFHWCYRHEFIERNPANHLLLKASKRASEEREPYSREDLIKIIHNLRYDVLHGWQLHKFWIPVTALFSGARQNEICQLQVYNIFQVEGIPCFHITEDGDEYASLKNPNSERIVPLHPVLLQLGILDYVLKRQSEKNNCRIPGGNRLWHTLKFNPKYTYSKSLRRFYEEFNRKYITDNPQKSFHSFRHNFIDNLKQQGVQAEVISAIVGHSIKSITISRYGKDYSPKLLIESMDKLDYGIDIFAILGKEPLPDEVIAEQIKELPVYER